MHGCGNDYVYVDCTKKRLDNPEKVSEFVSDRHFGIGSDGLILINPSEVADFEMAMYNADGSRGEMCGNGIRCVAKFVYDKGLTDKTTITIETLAGIKTLDLTVKNGAVETVKVNMGSPELKSELIPVVSDKEKVVDEKVTVDGVEYYITCVSMGNPHCVTFLEQDVRTLDLPKIGPSFENNEIFPKRINTEFVNIIDRTHLRMRVWERGSGETLACGTGACATAVAAIVNGYCDDTVDIELLGGHLSIQYDRDANLVFMTGPATIVYDGEINI